MIVDTCILDKMKVLLYVVIFFRNIFFDLYIKVENMLEAFSLPFYMFRKLPK